MRGEVLSRFQASSTVKASLLQWWRVVLIGGHTASGEESQGGGDVPSLVDSGILLGLAVGCKTCRGRFGCSASIAGESDYILWLGVEGGKSSQALPVPQLEATGTINL